ncbi:hypothetical protein [Phascolarctobacterium sp.]|uniref:hypothetical protein n=1 Tax=Phascolarctobacterium sp. TaxID=2049039 RepID=UPI0038709753
MATIVNSTGLPIGYTGKFAGMTSINEVNGKPVGYQQKTPWGVMHSDAQFTPIMYEQKCGNTTVYTGMDGLMKAKAIDLGNGNHWVLDSSNNTIGYWNKKAGVTTFTDGKNKLIGSIKD